MNLWDQTVAALKATVDAYEFIQWIQPIEFEKIDEDDLLISLSVPDESHGRWLRENYLSQIQNALKHFTTSPYRIEIASRSNGSGPRVELDPHPGPQPDDPSKEVVRMSPGQLVARYRFESFVDGPNNQFALTAARAAADRPGTEYNPLFIYGGVGLGKTHLLHAVGHAVAERIPDARVLYVTSETYVNDLISAIRTDRMYDFRRRYRDECDVLLVDDVQFISGKDRTQEEFFHMFNTLYSSRKQIVMTCDQLPRSIPDMEDRLKSRFEWGLIADIKPPGFETRVAILTRKAEEDGFDLPDDVAMLLARHVHRNVRELEGALMRLEASARIFRTNMTLAMARDILGDLVSEDIRRVSVDAILKVVAHDYNVSVNDLKGPRRHRNITIPRQIAMTLARELTDASLPQIGTSFGGRDHTTVINALKRIEQLSSSDPDLATRIDHLRRQLIS